MDQGCPTCGSANPSVRSSAATAAPLYAWFTEGLATRDLQDAKALLEELG